MSRSVVCLSSRKLSYSLMALSFGAFLGCTLAPSSAFAQTPASTQYSSSADQHAELAFDQGLSVAPSRSQDTRQNSGGYGNGGYRQYPKYGQPGFHHIAIEAGAGFDSPLGNTSKTQTTGYNIKFGGGWNFSRRFGVLAEYEFNRTGIPDNVLAAAGAPQGNVHLWGFSLDPIAYYKTTGSWGGYVTGGAGFYRKVTSFTATVATGQYYCDFYGYCYPDYQTLDLGHFSSNQAGLNIGTGLTHNIGDGGAKVFAEARYLWVNSPASTQGHIGSGTVSMIPVTFGVRF
jgi:hypothetical protein